MSIAFTGPVQRWRAAHIEGLGEVASRRELADAGISHAVVTGHLAARRWQRVGSAIVLHNSELSSEHRELAALVNCGPRSALTAFTATARWGLSGWGRDEIHVLAPAGTRRPALDGVVLHRVVDWADADVAEARRLHRVAPSLLIAAGSFKQSRYACAILAAAVQQRLVTVTMLRRSLQATPKLRHLRAMSFAIDDIEQGAHALSEIDFRRLCKRHGLPMPRSQALRVEPSGRRRYLDAEWDLPSGRVFAVEVDGAIHLRALTWLEDQLRQNELVIGGTPMLRFPSVLVREDAPIVPDQIRRGLRLWTSRGWHQ